MVSKKNPLKVLAKSDIDRIHGATMEVLSKTGVMVDSEEALGLLERDGYKVDRKTKRVLMTEAQVMEAVKSCKRNFRWRARNDKNSFDVIDGRTKFGPGAQCLYFMDPYTDEFRLATLRDGVLLAKLMDALPSASVGYVPVYPHDVPAESMSIAMWAGGLINTSKPQFGGSGTPFELDLMLRFSEMMLGDREMIRKHHLFPGYIDPISPLAHDKGMTETLLRYAGLGQPVFVMVMALAGGTGPASLAGLLVQQNAEILSSVAIAKCVTKNPKIIYGSVSCPLDMRSGIAATGAPEFSLISIGTVQMANRYGLPSDVGVQSDSKTVDAQTSYEKALAATSAVLAGADIAELFMGSTEAFNASSPIQMVIDDEIASDVHRMAAGIEVTDDSLSVDVIGKIGPQGNFLKHPKTMEHFRRQHLQPALSDRRTRQKWQAAGSPDVRELARERMESLLRTHQPDPLEPELARGLSELLAEHCKGYTLDMFTQYKA